MRPMLIIMWTAFQSFIPRDNNNNNDNNNSNNDNNFIDNKANYKILFTINFT